MIISACGSDGQGSAESVAPIRTVTTTTLYDTTRLTPLTSGASNYLCEDAGLSAPGGFDCWSYSGGVPRIPVAPSFADPDLFCSRAVGLPDCSEDWYPDELEGTVYEVDGVRFACKSVDSALSSNDLGCYFYDTGDPAAVMYRWGDADLYCKQVRGGIDCSSQESLVDDYSDLTFLDIGLNDYVCENGMLYLECYEWSGIGSPRDVIRGFPDYYCDESTNECTTERYP